MARLCPVDHRGLGYGPQGVCGRAVPFGGFRTVQNAEEMFGLARILWDVTTFLDAADGLPEVKSAKDFIQRGGEYARTFHAVGHKDSHERLPGREAGAWMASAKQVYAAASMDGSIKRMNSWLESWYPVADQVEQEVRADPDSTAWPETTSLQQDPLFRQGITQGDKEKERRARERFEVDRRFRELAQARIETEGLREELGPYTVGMVVYRYLPQRRARFTS